MTQIKESKQEELFRLLRKRINDLPDGAGFPSVRQIMREYNLSQFVVTPVWGRLQEMGLLESFVGRGTFVRKQWPDGQPRLLMLVNDWPGLAIAAMEELLSEVARESGFQVEEKRYSHTSDIFARLNEFQADALVLDNVTSDQFTPEQALLLARSSLPTVLSRSVLRVKGVNYVCGDNVASGILAANTLRELGHHKVALLYSEPHQYTCEDLVHGFEFCARSGGMEVVRWDCQTNSGESSVDNAYRLIRRLYQKKRQIDDISAVFIVSDESAVGAIRAFHECGVAIPQELSVLGFGNTLPQPERYQLSTIDIPQPEIARRIVEILDAKLRGYPTLSQVEIQPQLILRESVIPYPKR